MANRGAKHNLNLATQPAIPIRFRCKVGKEWKALEAFSNNQQKLVQRQIEARKPVDAANSGMTCREHSSGSRQEIKCELCRKIRHVDEFSFNSRRNGVYQCKRCVAWIETQEPDVTPTPLATGHISVEEVREIRGEEPRERFVDSTDFFADNPAPQAPITALSSLGLEDLDTASGVDVNALIGEASSATSLNSFGKESSTSDMRVYPDLPPHLRGKAVHGSQNDSSDAASVSSSAHSTSLVGSALPPHLRHKLLPKNSDVLASGLLESDDGSVSVSTATTLKEKQMENKPSPVSFYGWDAAGKPHLVTKSVTVSTQSGSQSGQSDAGAEEPVWEVVQPRSARNKWPKASESRLSQVELRRQGANHHVVARNLAAVPEYQREAGPISFCEPDEDDEEEEIYD